MVPWLGSGERLGELCSYDLELKDPLNPKLAHAPSGDPD